MPRAPDGGMDSITRQTFPCMGSGKINPKVNVGFGTYSTMVGGEFVVGGW